jgi:hypothetical protein
LCPKHLIGLVLCCVGAEAIVEDATADDAMETDTFDTIVGAVTRATDKCARFFV